jgi:phosphoribosyl-AMP cyclohydrolase
MNVEKGNLKELKYNADGLIPAIIQDGQNGRVLMLAYMNAESLQISMEEGRTCYWSRSRRELWRKGETSGHFQRILNQRL